MSIKAWYFANKYEFLRYGDGRPIRVGDTHSVEVSAEKHVALCEHGLHASRRIIDAIAYAPWSILYEVELSGEIEEGKDKLAAEHRKYIRRIDAESILKRFASECAISVIHLWDAPDVVKEFLETGDEELRGAAMAAASDASRVDAIDTASDTAMTASRAAAWHDACDAALVAASSAARVASSYAARVASMDAAGSADWLASRDAARDAAWSDERTRQEDLLLYLVEKYTKGNLS